MEKFRIEAQVEIEVRCDGCGDELECKLTESAGVGQARTHRIDVEACERCLKKYADLLTR